MILLSIEILVLFVTKRRQMQMTLLLFIFYIFDPKETNDIEFICFQCIKKLNCISRYYSTTKVAFHTVIKIIYVGDPNWL